MRLSTFLSIVLTLVSVQGDDSEGGLCTEDSFRCLADGVCLQPDLVCDGVPHCVDASDEFNCTGKCQLPKNFQCTDGQCLDISVHCNSVKDCTDGSDELNCSTLVLYSNPSVDLWAQTDTDICTQDEYKCPDGTCISRGRLCDGYQDCHDSSDEKEGCALTVVWSEPPSTTTIKTVLELLEKTTEEPPDNGNCSPKEFHCGDGTCIPLQQACDWKIDCVDGSDELQGCVKRPDCFGGFLCPNGHCLHKEWRCDGVEDCADGSDESNCGKRNKRVLVLPKSNPSWEYIDNLVQERQLNMKIHLLQVEGLELEHEVAREQLQAAKEASDAARSLAQEQLQTAVLQRRAAEEKLHQQMSLFQLRRAALQPQQQPSASTSESFSSAD